MTHPRRLDATSGLPAYLQLAADIRERIETGEYGSGDQLPSERDLADLYAVSRPTVRQAIAELRTAGIVTAQHGRGLYVRPQPTVRRLARNRLSRAERDRGRGAFTSDATSSGFVARSETEVRREPADAQVAELLNVVAGAEVLVRDRLMSADDQPVMIATSRLPLELVAGTPIENVDSGPGGIYARLAEIGHEPARFEEAVSTRMPTPAESSQLQLVEGTPVLRITRVAYTAAGRAVEVNSMILAGDRFELIYDIDT